MSVYYPSFNYMGKNSLKDKNLIVVSFDANQGETDTFLGLDPIYSDSSDGSRRLDYGAKYNSVAVVKIELIKSDGADFTVSEVRDFLRWTTGVRHNSYLDLLDGDEIKFSFLGRVTNAFQQKMDGRTIGLAIEFTSVSPYAYSLVTDGPYTINGTRTIEINNKTDDLYSYLHPNVIFNSTSSSTQELIIENYTTGDIKEKATKISNVKVGEIISLESNMMISSTAWSWMASVDETTIGEYYIEDENGYTQVKLPDDYQPDVKYYKLENTGRVFGNDFNHIYPRLVAEMNDITVTGTGVITFKYAMPVKIGDCAIDIEVYSGGLNCDGNIGGSTGGSVSGGSIIIEELSWDKITNKPTTLDEFNLKEDYYTASEIDEKLSGIQVGDVDLSNYYTKEEVNALLSSTSPEIEEEELNAMLKEILQ